MGGLCYAKTSSIHTLGASPAEGEDDDEEDQGHMAITDEQDEKEISIDDQDAKCDVGVEMKLN